ncbi:MAG: hypothetical protein KJ072_21450 [Verrucomicrobia bacterium]|nr:hypothetical protein [Verrucomicrobiota bacterium]
MKHARLFVTLGVAAGIGLLPSAPRAATDLQDIDPDSFSIEAEHFDFDGGQSVEAVSTMPYAGNEYDGLAAVHDVDYRSLEANDNGAVYRTGESPNVPMAESLGPRLGRNRPGFEVTTNYRIGWVGNGEWYNYTRQIPAGSYRAYVAMSFEGTAPGQLAGSLDRVVSGQGTPDQVIEPIGTFSGPGSGSWGNNDLTPVTNPDGTRRVFALPGGTVTLRLTTVSGDFDWFTLEPVLTSPEPVDLALGPAGGPFLGEQILAAESTPAQTLTREIDPATGGSFDFKLINAASQTRELNVRAREEGSDRFKVRYYRELTEVTDVIRSPAGMLIKDVPAGGHVFIRADVVPMPRTPGGLSHSVILEAINLNSVADVVRLDTPIPVVVQPDLLIQRADDVREIGRGIYDAAGTQIRSATAESGQTAAFRVRLVNNGNTPTNFQFDAPAPKAGWHTRFFRATRGLSFNGTSDFVALGSWQPGTQWTVEAWVKLDSIPAGRHGIAGGFADGRDWGIALSEGQLATIYLVGARVPANLPLEIGKWYHLAGRCDGAEITVWVNGILEGASPSGGEYPGTSAGARIAGEACCGGNNFPGVIRDVRVWNRPLTAAELAQPVTGTEVGLLGAWPLDDGQGWTARDLSSFQRTGVVNGSPAWTVDWQDADLTDVTDLVATGLPLSNLQPGVSEVFIVHITPQSQAPEGDTLDLLIRANASSGQTDTATLRVRKSSTPSLAATYTTDADFELGRAVAVGYSGGSIQLTDELVTLPFIWVPNSNEATVSKVDTRTGREIARYRTSPRPDANPSRTTVDLQGNCWVANRQTGSAVKLGLLENGYYADRNGNGIIDTSLDRNGDGNITGDELLPWGQDECVLFEISLLPGQENTYIPGTPDVPYANDYWNPGTRGVGVDPEGNVWLGTYGTHRFYQVNNETGQIFTMIDLAGVNHTSYGAVIDANAILWSSGQDKNHLLRLDTRDFSYQVLPVGYFCYGLGLDRTGHLYISGWQQSLLSRFDIVNGTNVWTRPSVYESRGVAITSDGDVWTANSGPGTVTRLNPDGTILTQIPVGTTPTGVAVDAEGKVWVLNYGDEFIKRINPANDSLDLSKRLVGGNHYGYSDMTGIIVRQTTTRLGSWLIQHDTHTLNTPWGTVAWDANVPSGCSLKVRARSSNNLTDWSLWEAARNGGRLTATPPARYLQTEVILQSLVPRTSPVLHELRLASSDQPIAGSLAYENTFSHDAGPEWSHPQLTSAPSQESFLGSFNNETVTLSLDDLPDHVGLTILADLYTIGRWDGNSTPPDLMDIRLENGLELLHASFNNGQSDTAAAGQSYPGSYPGASYPALSGADATQSLGYDRDATYSLRFSFAHTAPTLRLVLRGNGPRPGEPDPIEPNPIQWGLDNVRVYVTPTERPPQLLALGLDPAGFRLRLLGTPNETYQLEFTPDFLGWDVLQAVTLTADETTLTLEAPGQTGFYRAVRR